ncbi:MAG: flagellar protein FlhE [Exilibacterium sp.]
MLGKVYDFKTKKLKVNALEYAENLFDINVAIVGGGWASSQEGPWVHRVGTLYSSPLLISPEALSVNAKITRVSWSWEVENYRPDLKVYLVDVNESPGCLNISRWGKGDTSVFNGRCANHQFKLRLEKCVEITVSLNRYIWQRPCCLFLFHPLFH